MMKFKVLILGLVVVLLALLTGCGSDNILGSNAGTGTEPVLKIGENSYTVADLEDMPQAEAAFNNVTYVGVSVANLLTEVGYDLGSLRAVKTVASDGYTVNYEPGQLSPTNVIVAYVTVNGAMKEDDGDFRMVLPDQEGNMNLRMLVEIQVVE